MLAEALSGFDEVWRLEARDRRRSPPAWRDPTPRDALTERYGERAASLRGARRLSPGGRGQDHPRAGSASRRTSSTRPLAEFSGGWRMRAALARCCCCAPILLLLDEPTNHLDLESLAWLENFLAAYEGTVVVVSHDRYFLNRMVTVDRGAGPTGAVTSTWATTTTSWWSARPGSALLEARARNQAKRVAEIERFIERFRYKATKARQVQSRVKMLEKVERIEAEAPARGSTSRFPQPPRTGRLVAGSHDVHKAYGDNVGLRGSGLRGRARRAGGPGGRQRRRQVHAAQDAGGRAAVRPRRARARRPRGGALLRAASARRARSHAHRARGAGAGGARGAHTRLRTHPRRVPVFSGDSVDKQVAVLSGGEKARLALAKMLVRPAALLCMDEPTNHLDLASKEVLEEALAGFTGTIVFISHDRYFINRIATQVVEVARGRLTTHLGTYDDYLDSKAAAAAAPATAPERPAASKRSTPPERSKRRSQSRGSNGCPRFTKVRGRGECGGHFWAPGYKELKERNQRRQAKPTRAQD